MAFNSFAFIYFLVAVSVAFFVMPKRWRWLLMLGASYYFYMAWRPEYIVLILLSTVVDYTVGLLLHKEANEKKRKALLAFSLVTNLGLLGYFKYTMFAIDTLDRAFTFFGIAVQLPNPSILLPVGISFYTFQTLSYTIDIYRRKLEPERNFGIFALFVTFFPQLVAGPIERAADLLPQLTHRLVEARFNYARTISGLQLIVWGLFKKVVIADHAAVIANAVYANPENYSSLGLILGTIAFGYQIYCDFSGYVDIARGAARIFDIQLSQNFNRPYAANSIGDFWHRWHITLYNWFRDYIYIPLGGSRVPLARWSVNVCIVFFVSGLWHGASWHFVVWGLLHGLFLILGRLWRKSRLHTAVQFTEGALWRRAFQVLLTYVLVHLAWIFFRADSLTVAWQIVESMRTFGTDVLHLSSTFTEDLRALHNAGARVYLFDLYSLTVFAIGIELVQWVYAHRPNVFDVVRNNAVTRNGVFAVLLILISLYLQDAAQEFIYFQF